MNAGRIDTHHHYIPGFYRDFMDANGLTAGGWPTPRWSLDAALALMDDEQISTGLLSLSSPGTHFGDDQQARDLARRVNDFGAELAKDRPDRFGLFATLPLPDVDGSIAEATRAVDELHADGVVVLSNVRGRYLGDPSYAPLWEMLAEREVVVFVHPEAPQLTMLPGLPSPLLDFPFDTTRSALHLVANGVLRRHPNLRIILSHAGGFLPYAAYRFKGAAQFNDDVTAETILQDLRRFYFDTALSSSPTALPSLLAFAEPTHITYGSDFPFAPNTAEFDAMLDDYEADAPTHHAINRGNAETLFPRLAV
ncbi:amidohydrolase family protein [Brevibacterium sp. 'Marine']|uniref:amidohydrolase family protein n=1 Tax=Brevibacterium sp. 'Marine' TaxID=2725563 RepID=UPI002006EA4F|nr:amidohydrolase family protein [Brevibacterium sp. 'Marine']